MEKADVAIVGGGPSGSICARILATKGLDVLLLEKAGRGRHKPCAGGISLPAYGLAPIPADLIERKIAGSLVTSASQNQVTVGNPAEPGFTVCRDAYDQWLLSEAEKSGATIAVDTKVKTIDIQRDKVLLQAEIGGRPGEILCRLVVGAFGCHSGLYRFLGLEPPGYVVGLTCDLSLPEAVVNERFGNSIEIYFDTAYANPGYSWIFPKKQGVNVGLFASVASSGKAERLQRFVEHHPVVSKKLAGAVPMEFNGKSFSAGLIPVQPLKKTYGNRFLLVGDAAGLADPLTYEGIGYALQSGALAAECILGAFERDDLSEDTLASYQSKWVRELYADDIKYALKLGRIMYGHPLSDKLGDAVVALAREDETINTALRYILNRKEPRKKAYQLLMSRKLKLMKRIGLSDSLRILTRLPT